MQLPPSRRLLLVAAASVTLAVGGCAGDRDDSASGEGNQSSAQSETGEEGGSDSDQKYPDIVAVELEKESEDTASFSVTVSSPYDSPERYADGWRVLDQDGEVLGEHSLAHDHADEQPFTRMQSGVTIPEGTERLTIEGRDQDNGYGGDTVTVSWS